MNTKRSFNKRPVERPVISQRPSVHAWAGAPLLAAGLAASQAVQDSDTLSSTKAYLPRETGVIKFDGFLTLVTAQHPGNA